MNKNYFSSKTSFKLATTSGTPCYFTRRSVCASRGRGRLSRLKDLGGAGVRLLITSIGLCTEVEERREGANQSSGAPSPHTGPHPTEYGGREGLGPFRARPPMEPRRLPSSLRRPPEDPAPPPPPPFPGDRWRSAAPTPPLDIPSPPDSPPGRRGAPPPGAGGGESTPSAVVACCARARRSHSWVLALGMAGRRAPAAPGTASPAPWAPKCAVALRAEPRGGCGGAPMPGARGPATHERALLRRQAPQSWPPPRLDRGGGGAHGRRSTHRPRGWRSSTG